MTYKPPVTATRPRLARRDRRNASTRRAKPGPSAHGMEPEPLVRYVDRHGRQRELIVEAGYAGSVLVVDRDRASRRDGRLVAHLGADEPHENAVLVSRRYLEDGGNAGCRPRRVTAEDLRSEPFPEVGEAGELATPVVDEAIVAASGACFRLSATPCTLSIPELRWHRYPPAGTLGPSQVVSAREAIARLESYEPVCSITAQALRSTVGRAEVSTTVLRLELARVRESPIVLNRRLREVVLATLDRRGLSMSEVAIRCGRIKRDSRGNQSGETSWLARRLGILPEGGQAAPTPWIHSEVLARIARHGLGVSPREVEL
jgi:hypothetical protein